mmetsp:Transcript_40645/g.120537  ORF Transcript_40645/g.120537 Transcript_40645/m.120537 type:complete len:221 (+) Transcript_40645:978-1640(+)
MPGPVLISKGSDSSSPWTLSSSVPVAGPRKCRIMSLALAKELSHLPASWSVSSGSSMPGGLVSQSTPWVRPARAEPMLSPTACPRLVESSSTRRRLSPPVLYAAASGLSSSRICAEPLCPRRPSATSLGDFRSCLSRTSARMSRSARSPKSSPSGSSLARSVASRQKPLVSRQRAMVGTTSPARWPGGTSSGDRARSSILPACAALHRLARPTARRSARA